MKKTFFLICILGLVALVGSSCHKRESYAELVKKEKKAISRFIGEHNIKILHTYPENGVFQDNEFFIDESGVYINVVDSGNGKRADETNRAVVNFRFDNTYALIPKVLKDTIDYSGYLEFRYGVPATYTSNLTGSAASIYLSSGITIPLKYVGENAVVRLIIPFKGEVGSAYQSLYRFPMYYGRLKYTKIVN